MKSFKEFVESIADIQYIKKYKKGSDYFSLWRKGEYWYELTYSSQGGKGFKSVEEWHSKSLEDIEADLQKKGYEEFK